MLPAETKGFNTFLGTIKAPALISSLISELSVADSVKCFVTFKLPVVGDGNSYHVLHVGGRGVDAAPQLVVHLEDLLPVGPEDGAPAPAAACVAGAVQVRVLLVAAQQLPELLGVWQGEGSRVHDTEGQEPDNTEPGHCDTLRETPDVMRWPGRNRTQPAERKHVRAAAALEPITRKDAIFSSTQMREPDFDLLFAAAQLLILFW